MRRQRRDGLHRTIGFTSTSSCNPSRQPRVHRGRRSGRTRSRIRHATDRGLCHGDRPDHRCHDHLRADRSRPPVTAATLEYRVEHPTDAGAVTRLRYRTRSKRQRRPDYPRTIAFTSSDPRQLFPRTHVYRGGRGNARVPLVTLKTAAASRSAPRTSVPTIPARRRSRSAGRIARLVLGGVRRDHGRGSRTTHRHRADHSKYRHRYGVTVQSPRATRRDAPPALLLPAGARVG